MFLSERHNVKSLLEEDKFDQIKSFNAPQATTVI